MCLNVKRRRKERKGNHSGEILDQDFPFTYFHSQPFSLSLSLLHNMCMHKGAFSLLGSKNVRVRRKSK